MNVPEDMANIVLFVIVRIDAKHRKRFCVFAKTFINCLYMVHINKNNKPENVNKN